MLIHVLQGERERAADNWSLGRFTIDFEHAPRGVPRIGVQFEIDTDGILHVLARDTRTGRQTIVEIKSTVDVADAKVQQMVEESVEHAFEDLASRRWIEATLRARETVLATRKAMADCADELEKDYYDKLSAAIDAVETALSTEDARTRNGDLTILQSASSVLDETTKPLAEILMDRAVESLLRKRGVI
jgi:molecular chaperone DnaK